MIHVPETEPFIQNIERQLGRTLASQVHHAFLKVPRHLFVPEYYEQRGKSLSWDRVQAIPEKIYRDEALVTQIDERGMPSSSTSQPSVMAVQQLRHSIIIGCDRRKRCPSRKFSWMVEGPRLISHCWLKDA